MNEFAANDQAFLGDFGTAFTKMIELGATAAQLEGSYVTSGGGGRGGGGNGAAAADDGGVGGVDAVGGGVVHKNAPAVLVTLVVLGLAVLM